MKLFDTLFKTATTRTLVLVDIAAESVAGAYVCYTDHDLPMVLYTRRLAIENRKEEADEAALLRTLAALGEALIIEGAPIVSRVIGSGSIERIIVSIDAPWQETRVRTEHIARAEPFAFTRRLVATVLERTRASSPGKVLAHEAIIGTILNGYETQRPYGKHAHRASIVILTSFIDGEMASHILSALGQLYHTKHISHIAKCSLRYQAMRIAFPHEPDALILDVSNATVSIVLMRRGFFRAAAEVPRAPIAGWVPAVAATFAEFAKRYPLPRTIFLLAHEQEIAALRTALDAANLGSLWLGDNPPKIVPVLAAHLTSSLKLTSDAPADLSLFLMALYAQHHDRFPE